MWNAASRVAVWHAQSLCWDLSCNHGMTAPGALDGSLAGLGLDGSSAEILIPPYCPQTIYSCRKRMLTPCHNFLKVCGLWVSTEARGLLTGDRI